MKNKSKILICSIVLISLCLLSIIMFLNNENYKKITQSVEGELSNVDELDVLKVGQEAKVSSLSIIQRKTGTDSFDENDEPGNDSSEENEIVRSFDKVTWVLDATLALNADATQAYCEGGEINIEATIPENCKDIVKWDLESMGWAENGKVTENGTKFTAKYSMSDTGITVPGKQGLVLVLNVLGASNGTTIEPTFKLWLTGNEEKDKISIEDNYNDKKVVVSATPNYNITLKRNGELMNKTTLDYGEGDIEGRIYGYSLALQLYNTNEDKGLKGIEYPKGDIKFDVDLNMSRTMANSTEQEDITDECTPILWNYKINEETENGIIDNRTMKFGSGLTQYERLFPYGRKITDRTRSTYQSGNISMVQEGEKIKVTISDYAFDGIFPTYAYYKVPTSVPIFGDNIGCINVSYFQIFVPGKEANSISNRKYYLTVSDSNFDAMSSSETIVTNQQNTEDDSISAEYSIIEGSNVLYGQSMQFTSGLGTNYETGDAKITVGKDFELFSKFSMSVSSDKNLKSATKFIKFDGDGVEPILYNDGSKYRKEYFNGDMEFNVWYITKKDGTNWSSQSEMNNANIEDMLYFSNIEDIPEGYKCIGEYFESTTGEITPITGDNNRVVIKLKVKNSATVGKTYGFTATTKVWNENVDRSLYTITKQNFNEWPKYTWTSGNRNYIKTEYDENGEIIPGTHNGGWGYGQSLLILGGELTVSKKSFGNDLTTEKTNYDMGKNEFDITYKLEPKITVNDINTKASKINLKIVDLLPKGVEYIPRTSNYNEPEVTLNEDGTTQLVWYINDKTIGDNIEPITYKAHINEESTNGTQYKSKAIISEVIGENGETKIGNSKVEFRTTANKINIVNLASYAVYQTAVTPITELNGNIHLKITAINKTYSNLNDFKLLDILPYNNDELGSKFEGNYTLRKIDVTSTNVNTLEPVDASDINLYITEENSARSNVSVKDNDLGNNSIWKKVSANQNITKEATGIALEGILKARERLEVDIYLKTNGNKIDDVYKNIVKVQTDTKTEEMQTSVVETRVIKRELSGKVWFDSNKNGIIDGDENYLQGVKLTLLNGDGSRTKDVDGVDMAQETTDENGNYCFENLLRGTYKVQIELNDNDKEITLKNIGNNGEINNKFNSNLETDEYTVLSTANTSTLSITNVNAGISYKDATVTVHYYLEGTTERVSEDVVKKGLVNDTYETSIATNIPTQYKYVSVLGDTTGKMTVEPIVVIYYYTLKEYSYKVNYYYNGELDEASTETETAKYDTVINSYIDKCEEGYKFEKAKALNEKGEEVELPLTIKTNEKNNIINVYYITDEEKTKDLCYTVKYLEKGTDNEIYTAKVGKNVTLRQKIAIAKEVIDITGFEYSNSNPEEVLTIGIDNKDNVIELYYSRSKYPYEIHYFYNGVEDEDMAEGLDGSLTAEYEKKISTVPTDGKDKGMVYIEAKALSLKKNTKAASLTQSSSTRETNSNEGSLSENPLVIGTDSTRNVINVYYKAAFTITAKIKDNVGGTVKNAEGENVNEIVLYGEDSKDKIIITPNNGYDIMNVSINTENEDGTKTEETLDITSFKDTNGVVTIPEGYFENMTANKEVVVEFKKQTKVVVKFLEKDTKIEKATQVTINGHTGEKYETSPAIINGYRLANVDTIEGGKSNVTFENMSKFDETNENLMTDNTITVIYWYEPIPEGTISVKYIEIDEEDVNNGLTLTSGKEIEQNNYSGTLGESQITERKEFTEDETGRKYIPVDGPNSTDPNIVVLGKDTNSYTVTYEENAQGVIEPVEVRYYYKRQYNITVKVQKHTENINGVSTEVKGGTVTGEDLEIFETVNRAGKNTKEIIMTPDANYRVKNVKVNGNIISLEGKENANKIVTLEQGNLKNIKEDTIVTVEFEKIPARVIIKYVDIDTNKEIKDRDIILGIIGDEYKTEKVEIKDYTLTGNNPTNSTGIMTEKDIIVTYYYKKIVDTQSNETTSTVTEEVTTEESTSNANNEVAEENTVSTSKKVSNTKQVKTGDTIYIYISVFVISLVGFGISKKHKAKKCGKHCK